MSAESSQGDAAPTAAMLSAILQRLVAANLFPAEYTGTPPAAGPGVALSGLPFDVDARFFSAGGDQNFVRLHDSFSGKDRWYTQGAIEAAGIGERIGRTWGSARWPAPIPEPANLSGDRQISAAGEAIPVADHVKGGSFRLFRTPDGVGYVRMTDSIGCTCHSIACIVCIPLLLCTLETCRRASADGCSICGAWETGCRPAS